MKRCSTNREDGEKLIWLFDIREPTNPSTPPSRRRMKRITWRKGRISVTTCMRTGRELCQLNADFATYQNAGVRAYDFQPVSPAGDRALARLRLRE